VLGHPRVMPVQVLHEAHPPPEPFCIGEGGMETMLKGLMNVAFGCSATYHDSNDRTRWSSGSFCNYDAYMADYY